MPKYILFLATLKRKRKPFLEGSKRGAAWDYPQERLDVECLPFCEIRNNSIPTLLFIRPQISTAGYGVLWQILWIDFRTCQKSSLQGQGLIITRASKRKCFGKYDPVILAMSYLKVLHGMIP